MKNRGLEQTRRTKNETIDDVGLGEEVERDYFKQSGRPACPGCFPDVMDRLSRRVVCRVRCLRDTTFVSLSLEANLGTGVAHVGGFWLSLGLFAYFIVDVCGLCCVSQRLKSASLQYAVILPIHRSDRGISFGGEKGSE